ncbi:restriction endonuclease [Pseudomonas sp. SWI36]|uniref:type II restriction endonuclease n=1 Tax=Pseudomonas sp. SWI36 TaxID=2083052 RepID=UPI000CE5E358|nr:type II restriction endonuclease [Pseudomonas sp. SWI36]AVD93718.1 restriction endonuclease [Pseudomonas sp. SWI36]
MESLRHHFTGIATKYLSRVDATRNSNQHEIGSNAFASILGQPGHVSVFLRGVFLYFGDGAEEPLRAAGQLTWYDARRHQPHRGPEYRLYYPDNPVTLKMNETDFCIVAVKPDNTVMIIVTPHGSTSERQLRWLFGIGHVSSDRFQTQEVQGARQVSIIEAMILEELGLEPIGGDENWLGVLLERFGPSFPTTAIFSQFARETCPQNVNSFGSADAVLMAWMEHEEMLFRTLERHLVQIQLNSGFESVEHFIRVSLSVQNRRKSRVGYALEHHLAAIFTAHQIPFGRQVQTENRATADFLFPGQRAYLDPLYPDNRLMMLASKSTCKDRWRQVLTEAARIRVKHLFTLEPGISLHQTNEMQAHNLQLVIPGSLFGSYSLAQQQWLQSLDQYISKTKQIIGS